jgi:Flp pilus assembly protein CpaB
VSNPPAPSGGAASKAFLIAAVVLGVLATVLAFAFIQNTAGVDRTPRIAIAVAKRDLTPAISIDPDRDFERQEISAASPYAARSLAWDNRNAYKSERVNRDIFATQPILLADLASVGQLVLERPNLALTIPAEIGMVIPGDNVKIIIPRPATLTPAGAAAPVSPNRLPFDAIVIGPPEGYKVLAVGGYLFKTRTQALLSDQLPANALKTVTLQVTEPQAVEIMSAIGPITTNQKVTLLMCPSTNTIPPNAGLTITPTTAPATNR